VLHSKVRSSIPRLPGEIRANPILCLQVGHDGRSAMELLITTRHSEANDRYVRISVRMLAHSVRQNFGTIIERQGTGVKNRNWFRRSRVDA
jgi:hypothetical protein